MRRRSLFIGFFTALCLVLTGQNWQQIPSGMTDKLMSVTMSPDTNMTLYAVGQSGNVYISLNNGNSWQITHAGTVPLRDIEFGDANSIFAVGFQGKIIKWNGTAWVPLPSGTTSHLSSISFPTNLTGFVVGQNGTILKTTNGGTTWTPLNSGTAEWLTSVHAYDTDYIKTVSSFGTVLTSVNGGASWNQQTLPGVPNLTCVRLTDPTHGWITGSHGKLFQFNAVITPVDLGTTNGFNSMVFYTSQYGFLGGDYGMIYKFDGSAWNLSPSPTQQMLNDFCLGADSNLKNNSKLEERSPQVLITAFAVGDSGTVLKYTEVLVGAGPVLTGSRGLRLYPNPVRTGICYVDGEITHEGISIVLLDLSGRVAHEETINGTEIGIDLRSISDGLYLARLRNGIHIFTHKVQVSRE